MSPIDRRRFLRHSLALAGAGLVGCAEEGEPSVDVTLPESRIDAAPEPAPSPSRVPSPSPSPDEPSPSRSPDSEVPSSPAASTVTFEVVCRGAWGADEAGPLTPHRVRQMTLHHTAVRLDDNRDAPARLRQHQDYHRSLGWPDIAYHVAVDRHGHAYELRRPDTVGDTATDYDPAGHFLVVALGDYGVQEPTAAQLEGLARAFAWGATIFGVGPEMLSGHRDHASTSCPGDHLQARIPQLRERIDAIVAGGLGRRDVCGPEGEAFVRAVAEGTDGPLEA